MIAANKRHCLRYLLMQWALCFGTLLLLPYLGLDGACLMGQVLWFIIGSSSTWYFCTLYIILGAIQRLLFWSFDSGSCLCSFCTAPPPYLIPTAKELKQWFEQIPHYCPISSYTFLYRPDLLTRCRFLNTRSFRRAICQNPNPSGSDGASQKINAEGFDIDTNYGPFHFEFHVLFIRGPVSNTFDATMRPRMNSQSWNARSNATLRLFA